MTSYRYPYKKLEKNDDYLKLTCLEYQPPGISGSSSNFLQPSSDDLYGNLGVKDIKGSIILPIPNGLPTMGNSVTWGETTLGPLQTMGLGIAKEAVAEGTVAGLNALQNAVKTGVKALSQTGRGQKTVQSFFAAKAVEQVLGQDNDLFGTVLGRTTGAVFNENVELLFRGVKIRQAFSFNFDITPRSKEEAEHVRQMIIFLKKQMSAKKGSTTGAAAGLFLVSPSVFKLEYMSGSNPHPYLNQFKISALSDISVNYAGSNAYATYSDGTPVHMQLSLSFQELTPIYDNDYNGKTRGTGY